jgi:EmrB/QacA subfamily drug resistance transporter
MLGLLSLAQFMLVLDVTIVNVALPELSAGLRLSRETATGVVVAYGTVFAALLLFGGRVADVVGGRRTVLTGLVTFTLASAVAGGAGTGWMLLLARAAQGVGAALLSPAALSLLTTEFHGRQRTRALAVWAALGGTGATAGVLLGGVLTEGPGWRWIFLVNVPVGLAVTVGLLTVLPARRRTRPVVGLDLPGALLAAGATGVLVYGLAGSGARGWTPTTGPTLVASLALYAALALHERRAHHPLLDTSLLSRRSTLAAAFLMLVATGLLVGGFFLGSFDLQALRGHGALTTGLLFLPVALATIAGAQVAGRVIAARGPRPVAAGGLSAAAAGAATAAAGAGVPWLVTGLVLISGGAGATFASAFTTALSRVDPHRAGLTSAVVNTFHELGGAVGVAVLSSIAATSITSGSADGIQRALTVDVLVALAAAVVAVLLVPAGRPVDAPAPRAH